VLAVIIGVCLPLPGTAMASVSFGLCVRPDMCVWNTLSSLFVVVIFFISGLQLDSVDPREFCSRAAGLGVVSVLLLSPLVGISVWLSEPGLSPLEFTIGLGMFNLGPTTICSGSVIVAMADGDVPLSLFLTIFTNIFAVFIMPAVVSFLAACRFHDGSVSLPVDAMILSLTFNALIPLLAGKMVRHSSARVQPWTERWRLALKLLSSTANCLIPFMRVSKSAAYFASVSATQYAVLCVAAAGIHVALLLMNFCLSKYFVRLDWRDLKTVVIMASQKSMPMTLSLIEALPPDIPIQLGLVTISVLCVALLRPGEGGN
jgi:sodium/bile acid cotransporter 7